MIRRMALALALALVFAVPGAAAVAAAVPDVPATSGTSHVGAWHRYWV